MIAHPSNPTPPPDPSGPPSAPAQGRPKGGPDGRPKGGPDGRPEGGPDGPIPSSFAPQDAGRKTQDFPPTLPAAISPAQAALLEALTHPAADPAALAAAHGITPTQLALWLRQPHIAEAHEALRQLHALTRRAWQEEVTREAIETLRETMKATDDPVERRRSATAILRAFRTPTRPNRARSASKEPLGPRSHPPHENGPREMSGERAPSPTPSSNPSAATHPSTSSPQPSRPLSPSELYQRNFHARLAELREHPLHPRVLRAIDADEPAPFPRDLKFNPEAVTNIIAARLQHLDNPTPHRIALALDNCTEPKLNQNAKDQLAQALAASPFTTCRPLANPNPDPNPDPNAPTTHAWTRTDHPLETRGPPDQQTASRLYTWRHPDGRTAQTRLHLTHYPTQGFISDGWWLSTPDTS